MFGNGRPASIRSVGELYHGYTVKPFDFSSVVPAYAIINGVCEPPVAIFRPERVSRTMFVGVGAQSPSSEILDFQGKNASSRKAKARSHLQIAQEPNT